MAAKIFAIVLQNANDEVKKRIFENFDQAFEYHDRFFLVRTSFNNLCVEVAEKVGLIGDDQIEGASGFVILQGQGYHGYTRRDLWEWLSTSNDLTYN